MGGCCPRDIVDVFMQVRGANERFINKQVFDKYF